MIRGIPLVVFQLLAKTPIWSAVQKIVRPWEAHTCSKLTPSPETLTVRLTLSSAKRIQKRW